MKNQIDNGGNICLDYDPKRFGLSYDPPQIVIEYQRPSSGKLYHHKINCYKYTQKSKISEIVDEIYKNHNSYLNHKRINKAQIIQLVEKLRTRYQENRKKNKEESKNNFDEEEYDYKSNENEDLNKVSKEELDKKKKQMDKVYEKNKIEYGDEKFQYDVRKDFNNDQYAAEWDDDSSF